MQWCIVAIRNLCDGNVENQKIIAGMYREGAVKNELLSEMGLELNAEGDKPITVIPIKRH